MFGHENQGLLPMPTSGLPMLYSDDRFKWNVWEWGDPSRSRHSRHMCPKGPQKMPILYFSLVLGTIALGNFSSAWSDCFWIIRTYKKKVLWWVKIDDFSTTAIAHSMYNINDQQKWPKKMGNSVDPKFPNPSIFAYFYVVNTLMLRVKYKI